MVLLIAFFQFMMLLTLMKSLFLVDAGGHQQRQQQMDEIEMWKRSLREEIPSVALAEAVPVTTCDWALRELCLSHVSCRELWRLFRQACAVDLTLNKCRMRSPRECWQAFEGLTWTGLGSCSCPSPVTAVTGNENASSTSAVPSSTSDCQWIRLQTHYNKCIYELQSNIPLRQNDFYSSSVLSSPIIKTSPPPSSSPTPAIVMTTTVEPSRLEPAGTFHQRVRIEPTPIMNKKDKAINQHPAAVYPVSPPYHQNYQNQQQKANHLNQLQKVQPTTITRDSVTENRNSHSSQFQAMGSRTATTAIPNHLQIQRPSPYHQSQQNIYQQQQNPPQRGNEQQYPRKQQQSTTIMREHPRFEPFRRNPQNPAADSQILPTQVTSTHRHTTTTTSTYPPSYSSNSASNNAVASSRTLRTSPFSSGNHRDPLRHQQHSEPISSGPGPTTATVLFNLLPPSESRQWNISSSSGGSEGGGVDSIRYTLLGTPPSVTPAKTANKNNTSKEERIGQNRTERNGHLGGDRKKPNLSSTLKSSIENGGVKTSIPSKNKLESVSSERKPFNWTVPENFPFNHLVDSELNRNFSSNGTKSFFFDLIGVFW